MKTVFVLLAICLLLGGCGSSYIVSIDSINSGSAATDRLCYIDSGTEGVTADDLRFKEFSVYVRRALESLGYSIVDNIDDAEVVVLLAYKVGGPQQESYVTTRPVYGQIGISTGYYRGRRCYAPSYGIIGTVPVTHYYTTYRRHIKLTAYDWLEHRSGGKEVMLWDTDVVSEGASDDLRQLFPIMMAAATPYLASNTEQRVVVRLREGDDEVEFIKGLRADY